MTTHENQSIGEGQTSHSTTTDEQREILGEKLDWLTVDHDDLREKLLEQYRMPQFHPSMRLIDQWEMAMIEHIRQQATEARRTLIKALDQRNVEISRKLDKLTPILRRARDGTLPYNEQDLDNWASFIGIWKRTPNFPIHLVKDHEFEKLIIDLQELEKITKDQPDSPDENHYENI